MSDGEALKAAFELLLLPSQIRVVRGRPLPDGMAFLLRLAARDDDAEFSARCLTERPIEEIRQAAVFFIEQILFSSDAHRFRVLGFDSEVPLPQLRRHMALLLKWLHPDTGGGAHRSTMALRVIEAWNDVKRAPQLPVGANVPLLDMDVSPRTPLAQCKRRLFDANNSLRKACALTWGSDGVCGEFCNYKRGAGRHARSMIFGR